ncbi:4-aminobutyrate aminotransferase-like enzyme/Ser/Thr protein kinase RdoA (MazF antagonist) [Microbacterium testaceum]|uniref:aminotransferase class III-fold pyridoxal phosphate-dependent enzyme n=1 Tax=Microbacterium testaceum TaxID=2033 RepID=UPI0027828D5E|nr:aminotransferase class III-fold pyridoxal phosphate-dependent enzyme [Microbacterium testaceum]MDQ1114692.1 4-aminobutyrate aminotransferase-like enzyme/Ser/Thr protein kinase RdoA (MazF antagonist) [Microbacterium testaceum]
MTDASFDYFAHGELPTPTLPIDEARSLLREVYGIDTELRSLGSQQDQNFLVTPAGGGDPLGVLKISNPVFSESEIEMQDAAAALVARAEPTLRIPEIVTGPRGAMSGWWETSQGRLHARVISFVSGKTLTGSAYLSPRVVERLGELSAAVSVALANETHPASGRVLQWDLRHAERAITEIAETEPDADVRAFTAEATARALAALAPVAEALPRQLGHYDVTDDNVLRPHGIQTLPDAVIDFGDVIDSWAVGEIAVTVSSVLHHAGASYRTTLPAIAAFDRRRALSDDEITALWPLVVLRGVVLVLSGRQQVRLDEANDYASGALDREFSILRRATAVPIEVATAQIRHALGRPAVGVPEWAGAPLLSEPGRAVILDAGTLSPLADEGAWLDDDAVERAAQRLLDEGAEVVVLPALRPVLLGAPSRTPHAPATVPTAAAVWFARPTTLDVPAGLSIRHGDTEVSAEVPARRRIDVLLTALDPDEVPETIRAADLPGWRAVVGDATLALGVEVPAAPVEDDLLDRREAVVAEVQEHYYARPPRIERGWREFLVDVDGRVYLDMVNNVASVGHAHPRIAAAVSRQTRLLNTNSRFHYAAITRYAESLASRLPDELDTVFFVNSGSEAVDLAIRLAMAATERRDVVAMAEAYHGWTYASDAVSTSIADNPNALETRPEWVHTVDAANSYRGRHRGADAAAYAPEAAARLRALAAEGHPPAAFLSETFYGNAGGVALPDGYLREVYATVRELGGLAVADEVQVGFGRLGSWFWGFEQQGVVPDIVAVAKSIGAGFPLGAVITRREVADRYRTQGYFFSSTGGSPLSSVVGQTVLDIIDEEQLQENARVVGAHLKARLAALGDRHPIVGTVHGSGLYLGLEFVRDRGTLTPATEETAAICDRLLELGVIMQPTGDHQNVLKIKPPLCVTRESADYFVDMLDRVLSTGY